jgi:pyruvate-formate lyase-activating enzyme
LDANTAESEIVFYGVTRYAENNLGRWTSEGLVPLCFVDEDPNKRKAPFKGYNVFSLDDAIVKYPNFVLYLALSGKHRLREATSHLKKKKIPQNRIRYVDPYEWRIGCNFGRKPYIHGSWGGVSFQFCCEFDRKKSDFYVFPFARMEDALPVYEKKCRELNELYKSGEAGPCENCVCLEESVYPSDLEPIENITFGTGFEGDLCNVDCIYCKAFATDRIFDVELYDTVRDVIFAFTKGSIPGLAFTNGEFLARKDAGKILKLLLDNDCKFYIVINGTIRSDLLAEIGLRGNVKFLNVSLDSGTRETYMKVKRRDYFGKIIENLKTYSSAGIPIVLKYIMLPYINDNHADIEGIVNLARKFDASVIITTDVYKRANPLPRQTLDAAFMLHNLAKGCGLRVSFNTKLFSPEDAALIKGTLSDR